MRKDLRLALNAATDEKLDLPMGKEAEKMYSILADSADYAALDFSSVFKFLDEKPKQ